MSSMNGPIYVLSSWLTHCQSDPGSFVVVMCEEIFGIGDLRSEREEDDAIDEHLTD